MSYKNIYCVLFLTIFLFYGCESWIEGYDDSPNAATEVSIDQLFTASQVNVFSFSENSLARTVAIWMQQMCGTDRQYSSLAQYSFAENDYALSWQRVYTTGGLIDLRKTQVLADEQGKPAFKGMAQVLEAFLVGSSASIWGDIPYSEAIDGSINNPKLDDQAEIYASLQILLDDAISNLSSASAGLLPINDMFFSGDTDKWIAAAYTLKARYYMHWVEVDPTSCSEALINADLGINSLDGSMKTLHTSESTENNSWYQFYIARDSYMTAGGHLVNLLNSNSDPRLGTYFANAKDTNIVIGADPGDSYLYQSYLNSDNFGEASPIDILSYEENLLIKAECSARLGNDAVAQEALQEAQTAAETKWGFSADSFSDVSLTGDDLFNKILEEKYVALFLNLETWNDYKRNCYPNVSVADTKPPVRVYYPEDERKTNPNIPDVSSQPLNNDNDTEGCE